MHPLGRKCNCICKKHKITGRNVLYALQKGVVYSVLQIIQNIFTFLDGSANNLQNERNIWHIVLAIFFLQACTSR